ncbi:hypothetical protein ACT6SE_10210 [Stenotrophomonas sp. LC732]|uniref:hypothetical protein n=1 Tax=Stenotrophomonas TaxID=40323 RepID=UPI000ABE2147|nr:hypothetical protein [Stenotrophomonas sp. Sm2017]MDQ7298029.1 hypothetical protein [Stenotrophomonas sp. Sm2017]
MDRERHEPTFSAPDLKEMRFRTDRNRPARQSEPTSPWLYIGVSAALLVVIAIGLIEWNARRQAAAMTRELMRPATPEEQAALDRQTAEWEQKLRAETAAELAQVRRTIQLDRALPRVERRPLEAGERCIDGRRFKRMDGGGWRDLPNAPC